MTTAHAEPPRVGGTLAGLLAGLLVAMLATSIISTSLPKIVAEIGGGQSTQTWIVSATLLAITVSTPVWGKLSDLFSRKGLLLISLGLFIGGSALAGAANEPVLLIAARAVQGLASGGLLVLSQIVIADIISPRDRGKYMGLFGAVMAGGTIGGPLIGGIVTDAFGWRWNFFGSLIVAAAAMTVIAFALRHNPRRADARVDYAGAVLIAAGISGLLIWVTSGGIAFPWGSGWSLSLLAAAAVLLVAAVVVERRVKEPIIPLSLFSNRGYLLSVLASLSVGVATYGVAIFMSQYLQLARAATPTDSGLLALPQVIMVTIASTVVGALVSRTGAWKRWMVLGAASQALGLGLLGTINTETPITLIWIYLMLVGWGIGSIMQNLVLMAENNVDPRQLGVASAGIGFFRTLGGTIGVAGLGALIAARSSASFDAALARLADRGVDIPAGGLGAVSTMKSVDPLVRQATLDAYARGPADAFLVTSALALFALVCIVFLPNRALSTKTRAERIAEAELEAIVNGEGNGIVPAGGEPGGSSFTSSPDKPDDSEDTERRA